jgi:hypothetical protein
MGGRADRNSRACVVSPNDFSGHGFLFPALVDRDLLEVDGCVPQHRLALELSPLK